MSDLRGRFLRALFALALAFALWSFVTLTENPDEQVGFEGLTVAPRGLAPGLVLVDRNGLPNPALPPVSVTIITDQRQRSTLRSSDLRAFVDLSGLGVGEHSLDTQIESTRTDLQITIVRQGITPAEATVRIEELISQTVPISLEIEGNLPFSFELGQPGISRNGLPIDQITISGPESRVRRVTGARVVANVDQIRASYSSLLQLQPVDANDQPVEGVTLEPPVVNVSIPIRPVVGLRLVPVRASISGIPAPGFVVTAVEVSPQLIALTGSSGTLERVGGLNTGIVDISGATTSLSATVSLLPPLGTSPGEGEPSQVTVTVQIEPITRPFQIVLPVALQLQGVAADLRPLLSTNLITATFSGNSTALDQLANQQLSAVIDVSGLGPGTYAIPPQITLPEGIVLRNPLPIVSVTLLPPPTPTSEPTEVPTPDPSAEPEAPTETAAPSGELPTPTTAPATSPTPSP